VQTLRYICLQPTAAIGCPSSLPRLKAAAAYPTTLSSVSSAATDGDKGPVAVSEKALARKAKRRRREM
jgi:hypothetical protein